MYVYVTGKPTFPTGTQQMYNNENPKKNTASDGGGRSYTAKSCSKLVKETEVAAAERCRKGMTKRDRGRSEPSSAFSSHVHAHVPPGIKEHDTLNIKAVTNTWENQQSAAGLSAATILTRLYARSWYTTYSACQCFYPLV